MKQNNSTESLGNSFIQIYKKMAPQTPPGPKTTFFHIPYRAPVVARGAKVEATGMPNVRFGAPEVAITVMSRQIRVWSTVFLCNTETKVVMGPYMAVSEPGMHCAREAWKDSGRSFPAHASARSRIHRCPVSSHCCPSNRHSGAIQAAIGWAIVEHQHSATAIDVAATAIR